MPLLKTIIVIPARLESSRLPHKVLANIDGKPMLWHVYHRCLQALKVAEVHVATDSEQVAQAVKSWSGLVWMTDSNCMSGTERIVTILDQLDGDIIVNVQGDQPLIKPALIDQLIELFEADPILPEIVTPIYPLNGEQLFDPNLVKVTCRHDGYALYFSRQPIPYVRDVETQLWSKAVTVWGHIGIYGYRRHVLEEYDSLPPSSLETAEKLEQLRFLQAGKRILTFTTTDSPISVDTQTDLEQVRTVCRLKQESLNT